MKYQWPDYMPGYPKFPEDDPQRNQRKSPKALDCENKPEKFSSQVMGPTSGQGHAQQKPHPRRIQNTRIPLLHASNLVLSVRQVKTESSVCRWEYCAGMAHSMCFSHDSMGNFAVHHIDSSHQRRLTLARLGKARVCQQLNITVGNVC
jgi:hypothetical protein